MHTANTACFFHVIQERVQHLLLGGRADSDLLLEIGHLADAGQSHSGDCSDAGEVHGISQQRAQIPAWRGLRADLSKHINATKHNDTPDQTRDLNLPTHGAEQLFLQDPATFAVDPKAAH